MRTVDINYRAFFSNRTKHIEVPERWEDLKPFQFEVCAQIHIDPPSDEEFIHRFFGIKKKIISKLSKFEIYKLTDLAGFAVTPSATISHFYIEEIPGTGLLSPTNRLGNITMEHFALLDTYFFKYVNGPTETRLCQFVAATYLKRKELLTDIDFTRRVNYIAKNVDKCTLYAIFLNYLFVRKWLAKSFRFLFNDDDDDQKPRKRKYQPPKATKNNLPNWVEIIDNFVGDDVLRYDEYTRMNCIRVFKTLNNRIKNFKKNAK